MQILEWSDKQKRAYHRVKSGVRLAELLNKRIHHIVLTSSEVAKNRNIVRDFQALKLRIKRKWNIDLQYFMVKTNEGFGVLHIISVDSGYIPYKWLSIQWMQIHLSKYVYIKRPPKHIANYVVSQYVSKQGSSFQRCSWSQNWVCKGFVRIWNDLKDKSKNYDTCYCKFGNYWYKINYGVLKQRWDAFLRFLSKHLEFNYFEYVKNHFNFDYFKYYKQNINYVKQTVQLKL